MLVVILAYLVKKYVQINKNGFFEKLKKKFRIFYFSENLLTTSERMF